ncbi:MAG: O-antigen ligase family protein [Actinomycetota bacterium]|nr:O-antigen ligase family protein [Actinomycetota bacterium]
MRRVAPVLGSVSLETPSWLAVAVMTAAAAGASLAAVPPAQTPLVVVAFAGLLALPLAVTRPHWFLYGGLLFASSDRLFAADFAGLTVKPGYVCFGYALLGSLLIPRPHRQTLTAVPGVRLIVLGIAGFLGVYVLAALLSGDLGAGAKKLLVIVVGALVPAAAIVRLLDTPAAIRTALRAFAVGLVVTASYGLYQFAAGYLGLPQGFEYEGVAGGLHRISGFSFEPNFFAVYLVAGLPLLMIDAARNTWRTSLSPRALLLIVLGAAILANSRATFVSLPVSLLGFLYLSNSRRFAQAARRARALVPIVVGAVLVGIVLSAAGFHATTFATARAASIFNPNEKASNAPRLQLYRAAKAIAREHPVHGVGPGNLGPALARRHIVFTQGHSVTANNIWLEAAGEGGLATIPCIAMIIAGMAWMLVRARSVEARALALGALMFVTLNGLVVSFMWDLKVWTVIALAAVVALRLPDDPTASERVEPG